MDGSINFNRTWTDYASGFGLLTGEFWLGDTTLFIIMPTTLDVEYAL